MPGGRRSHGRPSKKSICVPMKKIAKSGGALPAVRGLQVAGMLLLALLVSHTAAWAQSDHRHDAPSSSDTDSAAHHSRLHFSHPLVSESVSPDTKIRLDYLFQDASHEGHAAAENVVRLEGEYAFHPSVSIEAILPFRLGGSGAVLEHAHVAVKFANFAFAEYGLLLGYGLEVGLPGGHTKEVEHSPHMEIGPQLNAGYRRGRLEMVALTTFELPVNQREEVETGLSYNLSSLYHISSRIQGLLELNGESMLAGGAQGESSLYLTAGIKLQPFADRALRIGLGTSFPLSEHHDFGRRVLLSAFYHL